MELEFQQTAVNFLEKSVNQIQNQEETLETVIPDSMPDADRILGCWGVPVIRSKEWRSGGMALNGGVEARVLYLPPEDETPQLMEAYLPFSIKWEQPLGEEEGRMRHDCRIRSMDARIINSRKILVRANLTARGEAFQETQEISYALREKPQDLEVLEEDYPLLLPVEMTEKTFLMDEDLDLPGTCPSVSRLVRVSMQPEMTDQKVMGGKAVFKGIMLLHILYLSPESKLCTWDFDVPFSQYAELNQMYDEEEELQTALLLSALDVAAEEDPHRLRLRASVLAQCMVVARRNMRLLRDAYSLRRPITPQTVELGAQSRLDHQFIRRQGEFSANVGNVSVIDAAMYLEFPRTQRIGERAKVEAPFTVHMLYTDENGKLQSHIGNGTVECETKLAEGCRLEADAAPDGRLQWSAGGGSCTLRGGITVTADSFVQNQIPAICGMGLGEEQPPNPERPSVIVRMPGQDGSLWELAKSCGSTVNAIRDANRLETDSLQPNRMLLIPVL